MSPALAYRFLTSGPLGKSLLKSSLSYIEIIFLTLESRFLTQVEDCIIVKKKFYILNQDLQGDVKKNFTTGFSVFKVAFRKKNSLENKLCNILQTHYF